MALIRRLLPAAFTLGAVAGGGLVGTTLTAPPAEAADCDVAVVVDFTDLPNGPGAARSGCAEAPGTGLSALAQAGFTASLGGPEHGNVVCDIDGAPGTFCAGGGLWAYWYMPAGSTEWLALDPAGAASRTPVPGSAEGWSYQAHPDMPAEPPAAGIPPGTTAPTSPPATQPPAPSTEPSTEPTPPPSTVGPPTSGPTSTTDAPGVPPGGTSSGGGEPTGNGGTPPHPSSVRPPDPGGPGSGPTETTQASSTSPAESDAPGTPGTPDGSAPSTNPGTDALSSSGVLGIGGGSPKGREITGPAAVVGLDTGRPLTGASPWALIISGAVLAGAAAGSAYLRHRRLTSDSGGKHS